MYIMPKNGMKKTENVGVNILLSPRLKQRNNLEERKTEIEIIEMAQPSGVISDINEEE